MKLLIITKKNSIFGLKLLNAFKNSGIEVSSVVVIEPSIKEGVRLFNSVRKRIGFLDTFIYTLQIIFTDLLKVLKLFILKDLVFDYKKLALNVICVKNLHSRESLERIRNAGPDIIILGQSGIVKKEILDIAKIGVLNAHPGIVPQYRGIDSFQWAAYYNDFERIGISVHWVNKGVDSGNVITVIKYKFTGKEKFSNFEETLYKICIDELVEVTKRLRFKVEPGKEQNLSEGAQYYKIPRKSLKIAKANFKNFIGEMKPDKGQD